MEEKLNIKKVIIAILILLFLIISIVVFVISRISENPNSANNTEMEVATTTNNNIFTDIENTISIEIPKKYQLEQLHNNEYLIKLTSAENLNVYISKLDKIEGRNVYAIARADRLAYLESYNSYSNLSELKALDVNGNEAYMYSFHYLDENLNKAFYIQVILMQVGENVYVFDIDFPLEDLVLYTNIATETLANFKQL